MWGILVRIVMYENWTQNLYIVLRKFHSTCLYNFLNMQIFTWKCSDKNILKLRSYFSSNKQLPWTNSGCKPALVANKCRTSNAGSKDRDDVAHYCGAQVYLTIQLSLTTTKVYLLCMLVLSACCTDNSSPITGIQNDLQVRWQLRRFGFL